MASHDAALLDALGARTFAVRGPPESPPENAPER
jgi:hypothetical protein